MLAISGFFPLSALKFPTFPLEKVNLVFLVTCTIINMVVFIKKKREFIIQALIITIWLIIAINKAQKRHETGKLFEEVGLNESSSTLVPSEMSSSYSNHMISMMYVHILMLFFVANCLKAGAEALKEKDMRLNDLTGALIATARHPIMVFKRETMAEKNPFLISYVSEKCASEIFLN